MGGAKFWIHQMNELRRRSGKGLYVPVLDNLPAGGSASIAGFAEQSRTVEAAAASSPDSPVPFLNAGLRAATDPFRSNNPEHS